MLYFIYLFIYLLPIIYLFIFNFWELSYGAVKDNTRSEFKESYWRPKMN